MDEDEVRVRAVSTHHSNIKLTSNRDDMVTFRFGDGLNGTTPIADPGSARPGNNAPESSTANARADTPTDPRGSSHGTLISEFRRRLIFFDHKLNGKITHAKNGEIVDLPRVRPTTLISFLETLCSQDGKLKTFQRFDNLRLAFTVATALEDHKFQQVLIQRIRTRVCEITKDSNVDKLCSKLMDKVVWVWRVQTQGRIGLRRVLIKLLAFICTGYEKNGVAAKQDGKEKGNGKKRNR